MSDKNKSAVTTDKATVQTKSPVTSALDYAVRLATGDFINNYFLVEDNPSTSLQTCTQQVAQPHILIFYIAEVHKDMTGAIIQPQE